MFKINTILLCLAFSQISLPAFAQCINGDCQDGEGIYIYSDKSVFIGHFFNGKANGFGTCYYSSGAKYAGEWYDHQYNGEGTYFYPDGNIDNGTWEYGDLTKSFEWKDTTANRPAKTWAIIIGISNYSHLTPLNYTDDDAHRLSAFLQSPEGGSLKDYQIKLIIDESATKANIIRFMHETIKNIGSNDQLIFYFSGHGFEDALAPIDINGEQNKLYHQEVINIITNNFAKQRLCILDACFAGGMKESAEATKSDELQSKNYLSQFKTHNKTAFIFSSTANESSIEQRGLRQGVFSHFLLKGLKGEADTDKDGIVRIDELSKFVKVEVKTYTNNYQNPTIINTSDNKTAISDIKR